MDDLVDHVKTAIDQQNIENLLSLLNEHPSIVNVNRDQGLSFLHYATSEGNMEIVKILINANANVNSVDDDQLIPFFYTYDERIMLLFLDSGIDVTAVDIANGDSLLHAAIRFSTPEKSYAKVIKALILKGAHVNAQNMDGDSPLNLALMFQDNPSAKVLIDEGADLYLPNEKGHCSILVAAISGNFDLLKYMVSQCGANLHITDKKNRTALEYAIANNHQQVVEFLLDFGVDINQMDKSECTPFIQAVDKGHLELARMLIRRGAEPFMISERSGFTALFYPAFNGNLPMIQYLVEELGIKIHHKDKRGMTPIDYAREVVHHTAVVEYLTNKLAEERVQDLENTVESVELPVVSSVSCECVDSDSEDVDPTTAATIGTKRQRIA